MPPSKRARFLLLLLLLPVPLALGGLLVIEETHRHAVKRRLARLMPDALYEEMAIPRHRLHELQFEHAHEFAFEGQMFDVVERRETADTVFFRVWRDETETGLKEARRSLLGAPAGGSGYRETGPPSWISVLKKASPSEQPVVPAAAPVQETGRCERSLIYSGWIPGPESPPPRA